MSPHARIKYACYATNISMAAVANLPPLLFLTFHDLYGISYSLLGLLVLVNFLTQLSVDLIFSFFSHRFNIPATVRITPLLSVVGLLIFALWPLLLPQYAYAGLLVGTVIFSVGSGLCEVLISPVIAALPSDNPERDMSKLHSVYAWGVVGVVLVATLFLKFMDTRYWSYLALLFALIPLTSCILFMGAKLPPLDTPKHTSGALSLLKNSQVLICTLAIFCGGASELVIAQWGSSYLELALGIPKVWGDLLGVALFAVMMGVGRSLYAKRGRHIEKTLLISGIGAVLCYLVAALSPFPLLGLCACALTGLCVAMMWPGTLIIAAERVPYGGVFVYAMMAAGGDFGAAVGPQLMGIVTDAAAVSPLLCRWASELGQTPEQLGMKLGILAGTLFPLIGVLVYTYLWKTRRKYVKTSPAD